MQEVLSVIYRFIHEIQKERGCAVLYLKQNIREHSDQLEKQFAIVDDCIQSLLVLDEQLSPRLEPFLNALRYIPAKRKYIVSHMAKAQEIIFFYSREIILPAQEILEELAVLDAKNEPSRIAAFLNFLQWKERVGLERAMGTHIAGLNLVDQPELQKRLSYIITEQKAYERMFVLLAPEGKGLIEKLNRENDIFQRIEHIHHALSAGANPFSPSMTALEWFNLFTAKMDVLFALGETMLEQLRIKEEAPQPIRPQSANLNNPRNSIENSVERYKSCIAGLKIFAGLSEEMMADLLRHARVVDYNKGASILMQGEQATRFYVVLKGWVKVFKGNIDGQESVLQMLSIGEALSDSSVMDSAPLTVSAQAVDTVTLLSIPSSIMREKLRQNHLLAVNMLTTISGRSQALMTQFEQLTLKSVVQRVGWFVLKLYLDGGENEKAIKLPYEKSIIASYLGMKPETFSRTLQSLKDYGVDVERSEVLLRDVQALCEFCDPQLATQCPRHNTKNCPNAECAKGYCALSA